MLTSLLPGLRDLRAPLAAGYLWLVAGWLYFAPRLPASANDAHGVLADIYRVIDTSDPIAVVGGITFAAYLLGILSTGLLTLPVHALFNTVSACLVFIQMLSIFGPSGMRERFGVDQDDSMGDQLDALLLNFGRFSNPMHARARNLVIDALVNRSLKEYDFREKLLEGVEAKAAKNGERWLRKLRTASWLNRIDWQRLKADSIDYEQETAVAREVLSDYLKKDHPSTTEAARLLVRWTIDVDWHAAEVLEELSLVPERIVNDRQATYERWDRLNAEAEFRQGIVPPLVAILGVLILRGVLDWPIWLVLATAPLTLLIQGISKGTNAEAQLLQTIEAKVVSIASFERLATNDLHWSR